MAEEQDGAAQDASTNQSADGAPMHFALSSAAGSAEARAFLQRQSEVAAQQARLIGLQADQLHEEMQLNLSHLRLRRFGDYTKSVFEIAVGLVALLIVCGLGTMVWSATQDRDLVVDAFSVPLDVSQTGLTGSVLAAKVLDRFGAMDRDVHSFTQDFSGIHGANEDVRVEIPDTGISIGELNRHLRGWLGHETHVTGELVHLGTRLSLTIRRSDQPGLSAAAAAGDLDGLVQKGAENLFRATEPLRYADYLSAGGRTAEAARISEQEARTGDARYRAAANISLAQNAFWRGDFPAIARYGDEAVQLDRKNIAGWFVVAAGAANSSHDEQQWRADTAALPLAKSGAATVDASEVVLNLPKEFEADLMTLRGDWKGAVDTCRSAQGRTTGSCTNQNLIADLAQTRDLREARELDGEVPRTRIDGKPNVDELFGRVQIALSAGDWHQAALLSNAAEAMTAKDAETFSDRDIFLRPLEAEAQARDDDIAHAKALTAKMPPDCDACMRAGGRVATIAHDWAGAARLFALVSARSPDIPFADSDWGAMLLAKGDFDGAIAKFAIAHEKGPHFADPLEMWGEALMLMNRSDLALAKFEEANKYAPKWGRLHLKWGEALVYSGKLDEANKQFTVAAHLDLSAADAAALARMRAHHV
jgi:tetratricopeptide (TPR) repeat protein